MISNASAGGCSGVSFAQPAGSPIVTGEAPQSGAIADFNRDGKPDLAIANLGDTVTILLGNGSGGFTQAAGSPVGAGSIPFSIAAGDLNLDGKPDLAVANTASNNVTILLGNGGGGFSQPAGSPVAVGTQPESLTITDFNRDGKPDLAVVNSLSDNVTILLGNGSGGFVQAAGSPVPVGSFPVRLTSGDVNLDGKSDVVVASTGSGSVTILLGNGAGGFTQPVGSPFDTGFGPFAPAIGDFNSDGKPDLALANAGEDNVSIFLGNGAGGFAEAAGSPINTGDFPSSVAIADFNMDGKLDLATANSASDNMTILLGNGSGGFSEAAGSPIAAAAFPACVAAGDLNLDGKPDLAVLNTNAPSVIIQLNTCAALPCSGIDFAQPAGSPFGTGSNPRSVAVGDFNGDGKADLAVANLLSTTVSILLGTGTGSFGVKTDFGTGLHPFSIAVGDLNGDGKLDLAVANENSANVSILLGTGAGTFGAKTDFGTGSGTRSVAVGDFNGDGKLDLAAANQADDTVSILLGTGTGSFGPKTNFGTGSGPESVAAGDFNGDGKLDLAVANNGAATVSILLGTETGSFGAKTDFGTASIPFLVAVGDLNGDGKLDLAVANEGNNNVSILLGTGTGSFGANTDFGTGSFPFSVAVGDFNGDGKLDLAVANTGDATVSILPGTGTGSFGATTNFDAGAAPISVAVGDFNGDGKLDLVLANTSIFTVSILLNTCEASPPPTITCPPNVTAVTPTMGASSATVTYPPPATTGADSSFCNPPSGSTFPVGCTTVTCTATGPGGIAACNFLVCVFNICLQDNSNPNNRILINTASGDYRFCCNGITFIGRGKLNSQGSIFTLEHVAADRRVVASANGSSKTGTASLQSPPGRLRCSITDSNTSNNTNCATCQ